MGRPLVEPFQGADRLRLRLASHDRASGRGLPRVRGTWGG